MNESLAYDNELVEELRKRHEDFTSIIEDYYKKSIFEKYQFITRGKYFLTNGINTIFINGCGGTGGWFIPKLAKVLNDAALKGKIKNKITLVLCDGGIVEQKNLIRQNFIQKDIGHNKAKILAARYAILFPDIVDIVYVDKYLANNAIIQTYPEILRSKFIDIKDINRDCHNSLVFNFVDNAISRRVIHSYFSQINSLVVDVGNNLYNGQLNTSFYTGNITLPNYGNYYNRNSDEVADNEFIKFDNCADMDMAINNPEQMFSINDFAATVASNFANTLFAEEKVYYSLVKFKVGPTLSVENLLPLYDINQKDLIYDFSEFYSKFILNNFINKISFIASLFQRFSVNFYGTSASLALRLSFEQPKYNNIAHQYASFKQRKHFFGDFMKAKVLADLKEE